MSVQEMSTEPGTQLVQTAGAGRVLHLEALSTLSIGTTTGPVAAGNQINLSVEGSPGTKVSGVVFEQHFHYGPESSSTPSEEEQPEDIDEEQILPEIAQALKKHYSSKAAFLVPFEWMRDQKLPPEEYYVDLDIVRLSRSNRFIKQESVTLERILLPDTESNLQPQSVLIHGEPGIGKTTVCVQLLYDWSTKKDSPLSDYPLVIFIPFRALDNDIDEFIVDLCSRALRERPPTRSKVKKILRNLGSKLLLLLDSLEELPHNVEDSFLKVLTFDCSRQQSLLYQATVIVTTRPNPPMEYIEVFNRHVRINGFSYAHQKEYVDKYFQYEPEKLELMTEELELGTYRGLGACPLMLYILCYLQDMSGDILKSTRATDIYATVTSLLIKRSANRLSDRADMVLDQRDLEHFLVQLGHLCCNSMREGRLYVTEGEILLVFSTPQEQKIVKGSGLIKLATYPQKIRRDYFEPSHRSFFEYLAAKSFKFELSKAMSQEKRFTLIQGNDRLLTATNSPVLIYLCGLDTEQSDNQLLSLEYFQQNEQKVTTNDPLFNLKELDTTRSAFSIVTSALLINEANNSEKMRSVVELTKHYDQTPNFTSCPPFFYEGYKKFLSCNPKPINKLMYDVGYGDYRMELKALKHAPKIKKLMFTAGVPMDRKQLEERDRSPFEFLRGILELENVNELSVTVKHYWVKAFVEEVDSSFNLRRLTHLNFEGYITWELFSHLESWSHRISQFLHFLSCDAGFVTCTASLFVDKMVAHLVTGCVKEVTFIFWAGSEDVCLTGSQTEVIWKEAKEETTLSVELTKEKLYSKMGFDDVTIETVFQVSFLYREVMKWTVQSTHGLEVLNKQRSDHFVSCYRSIQLGEKDMEYRGHIPVISRDDKELMSWYNINHDGSTGSTTW